MPMDHYKMSLFVEIQMQVMNTDTETGGKITIRIRKKTDTKLMSTLKLFPYYLAPYLIMFVWTLKYYFPAPIISLSLTVCLSPHLSTSVSFFLSLSFLNYLLP